MPPSVKIIEQVTKNQKAVEKVENSDMSDDDKEDVITAIQKTQDLAVQSSQAWEQCKVDLSEERENFWMWLAIASGVGAGLGFLIRGKF